MGLRAQSLVSIDSCVQSITSITRVEHLQQINLTGQEKTTTQKGVSHKCLQKCFAEVFTEVFGRSALDGD